MKHITSAISSKFSVKISLFFLLLSAFDAHSQTSPAKQSQQGDNPHSIKAQDSLKSKVNLSPAVFFQLPDTMKLQLRDSAAVNLYVSGEQIPLAIDALTAKIAEKKEDSLFVDVALPFITLILGAMLTLLIDGYRARSLTWQSGQRWIAESKVYSAIVASQIPHLQKVLDTEDPNVWGIHELVMATNLDGEIFNGMNKEELLRHLKKDGKMALDEAVKLSNGFTGDVSLLQHLHGQLLEIYESYKNNIGKACRQVNGKLQEIGALLGEWQTAMEQRPITPQELATLTAAFRLWTTQVVQKDRDEVSNLFLLEASFLDPLIAAIVDLRADDRILAILNIIAQCKHTIEWVRDEKRVLIELADKLKNRYQRGVDHLKDTVSKTELPGMKKQWYQVWRWE